MENLTDFIFILVSTLILFVSFLSMLNSYNKHNVFIDLKNYSVFSNSCSVISLQFITQ
jgi:hypothetical protein